jgi:hypothetical protein
LCGVSHETVAFLLFCLTGADYTAIRLRRAVSYQPSAILAGC